MRVEVKICGADSAGRCGGCRGARCLASRCRLRGRVKDRRRRASEGDRCSGFAGAGPRGLRDTISRCHPADRQRREKLSRRPIARRLRCRSGPATQFIGLEVWRVLPIDDATPLKEALSEYSRAADAVLVEPRSADGRGGKGVKLPLALAAKAHRAVPHVRFVLAGGLDPESVGEAIRVVRPDVVDVSSGVELSPGIKDSARMIRFLENVRVARTAL